MFYFFESNLLMQTSNNALAIIAPNILTGFMFSILTIVLAYIAIKSRYEGKQLLYFKKTNFKETKRCRNYFDANSGKSVTYTKVLLWNSGKARIYREDIIDNIFQINIREPYKIINSQVIYKNTHSQFTINPNEQLLSSYKTIDFSWLKQGEGAVIEISHTGEYSKGIKVSGEMRRYGEIQNAVKGIEIWAIIVLTLIMYAIAIGIVLYIFLYYFNLYESQLDDFWKSIIGLTTVFSMYSLYLYCSFNNSPFYKFIQRNILSIPKDLYDAFSNDDSKLRM